MADEKPIPMRLICPECGVLHLDEGLFATKPHHTHSCQACGLTWRPAVVCTVGVEFLPGFKNFPESPREDLVAALATERLQREEAETRAGLVGAQLLAVGSVLDGDDKGEPCTHPRWTPTLDRARCIQTCLKAAESRATKAEAENTEMRRLLLRRVEASRLDEAYAELAALRPVVEAARAWRAFYTFPDIAEVGGVDLDLWNSLDALPAPPAVKEPTTALRDCPKCATPGESDAMETELVCAKCGHAWTVAHPRGSDGERELYRDPHAPEPAADLARRLGFPKNPEAQRRDHYLSTMHEAAPAETIHRTGTWTGETRPTDEMLAKAIAAPPIGRMVPRFDDRECLECSRTDGTHRDTCPSVLNGDVAKEMRERRAGHCKQCGGKLRDWDYCDTCSPKDGAATETDDEDDGLVEREDYDTVCRRLDSALSERDTIARQFIDNSDTDGTDAAHPAWWRGEKAGSEGVARALQDVVIRGALGRFGSAVVEEAAQAIEALRGKCDALTERAKDRDDALCRLYALQTEAKEARDEYDYSRKLLYRQAVKAEETQKFLERENEEKDKICAGLLGERDAIAEERDTAVSALEEARNPTSIAQLVDGYVRVVRRIPVEKRQEFVLDLIGRRDLMGDMANRWSFDEELVKRIEELEASAEADKRELWLRATKAQQGMNGGEWTPLAPYEPAKGEAKR
jgi:hypothetical protein